MMSHFKILAVFCLITISWAGSATTKDEAMKRFQTILDECKNETGVKAADVQDLMNKKPPSNMEAKCFRACLMKKYNVMNSSGRFDKVAAMNEARKMTNGDTNKMNLAQSLINTCGDISVSSNYCQAATEYGDCFRKQIKTLSEH